MTIRAVLLGLLGGAFVCGASFFNDRILRQTYLVGNNMPVSVYGALILFLLLVNPLMKRFRLRGSELAVILTLTLATCCIPGSGFLRTFTSTLILPYHHEKLDAGWREEGVVQMLPKRYLADVNEANEDKVLGTFVQGLAEGKTHSSPKDIPLKAWGKPFALWLPMVCTLWFAMIGLSLFIHKQWAAHEHLPYPVASFANALLPEPGRKTSSLFVNRLFWMGAGVVLFIHMNNYLFQWFPDYLIQIPTVFRFGALGRLVPTLTRGGGWGLLNPRLFFTVVGICYFIPTDLSFTFGIGPFMWAFVVGSFAGYGINLNNVIEGSYWYTGLRPRMFILFGSNVGLFLALVYTGRHYYSRVLKAAFRIGKRDGEADPTAVWGCRVFLGLMLAFVVQMSLAGIDWQLSLLYAMILVVFYVVMTRIICESGMFHLQSNIFPCAILWGVFGANTLGASTLLMMQFISLILVCDPRESLMPFMSNSLKMLDFRKASIGKTASWSAVAILMGLALGLAVTLYIQYDQGNSCWEGWAEQAVPTMQFNNALAVKRKLLAQGTFESGEAMSGWQRFANMTPNKVCMYSFAVGFALVLLFSVARLRFRWWPLHPLLFVTWCTSHIAAFSGAFLMGWLIKRSVVKYGGNAWYNRLKPMMYGLIAGELLSAVIPSIVGTIYYLITGDPPKAFHVLLG